MIFSWQRLQWQQLWQAHQAGRLSHALLLTGMAGNGKAQFADNFSRALVCQAVGAEGEYCGTCHLCRLIEGRAHPDVMWVEPEKAGAAIKVDQVREVSDFVNQTALQGGKRIVLINPADHMNMSAANALLKTLEEPPADALIILISSQPSRLPATVRSRCQQIVFQRPSTADALAWLTQQEVKTDAELLLSLANGAPLAAIRLEQDEVLTTRKSLFETLYLLSQKQADPIKSAAALQDTELLVVLDFIVCWLIDLLRLQIGGDELLNKDYLQQLSELKQRTVLSRLVTFMEHVQKTRMQIERGMNLNKQMVLEAIFIRWVESV